MVPMPDANLFIHRGLGGLVNLEPWSARQGSRRMANGRPMSLHQPREDPFTAILMLRRHAVHSWRHLHFLIVSRDLEQTGGLRAFFYVL
jgi:hypothetical protein